MPIEKRKLEYGRRLEQPDRLAAFLPTQAKALLAIVDVLALEDASVIDENLVADELFRVRGNLAERVQ